MTYIEWYKKMNRHGWHQHTITKSMTNIIIEWRHDSVTLADGTPITVDEECANKHWLEGSTPPPF